MSAESLLKRGMKNSYVVDLNDVDLSKLSCSYLINGDKNRFSYDFQSVSQIRVYESKNHQFTVSSDKRIIPINEASRRELLKEADLARKARAKKITVKYAGITEKRGWIKFIANSQYTPSLKYTVYIQINDADDMKYFKEFNYREISRLFINGDLSIYCSCPDFLYKGYKYMAYQMGYGIFKENRFPKIRNPKLEGSICKHLIAVLQVLGFNWSAIARDMKRSKFYRRKMELEGDDLPSKNKGKKRSHKY